KPEVQRQPGSHAPLVSEIPGNRAEVQVVMWQHPGDVTGCLAGCVELQAGAPDDSAQQRKQTVRVRELRGADPARELVRGKRGSVRICPQIKGRDRRLRERRRAVHKSPERLKLPAKTQRVGALQHRSVVADLPDLGIAPLLLERDFGIRYQGHCYGKVLGLGAAVGFWVAEVEPASDVG